jgi:hypothetical protein
MGGAAGARTVPEAPAGGVEFSWRIGTCQAELPTWPSKEMRVPTGAGTGVGTEDALMHSREFLGPWLVLTQRDLVIT